MTTADVMKELELAEMEELIENSYWRFDARRKGYGNWLGLPMSERDAFKAEMRLVFRNLSSIAEQ